MTHHYALLFADGSLTVFRAACTAEEVIEQCAFENAGFAHEGEQVQPCEIDIASVRVLKRSSKSQRNLSFSTNEVIKSRA